MIRLIHGDCLEVMAQLAEEGVKVDAVITDPPYGITACQWDLIIPFDFMWKYLEAIRNNSACIVLFGSEPFSSKLRISNLKNFKYDWIWHKNKPTGLWHAEKRPMKQHEIISVFYNGSYFPQKENYRGKFKQKQFIKIYNSDIYGGSQSPFKYKNETLNATKRYPGSIQYFDVVARPVHPTQKPVALIKYLIKTYTMPRQTVLDFAMGSGTTGVACKELNRDFIGIEKDPKYFGLAKDRIYATNYQPDLFEDTTDTEPAINQGELWD